MGSCFQITLANTKGTKDNRHFPQECTEFPEILFNSFTEDAHSNSISNTKYIFVMWIMSGAKELGF